MLGEKQNMRIFPHWLEHDWGLDEDLQENLVYSALILLGLWLISRLLFWLIKRRQPDLRKQYGWRKVANYLTTGLGIILLANVWFTSFQSVATFFGLLSAGLVLALREPLLNMAGWFFLIWKRPIRIGDRIEVQGQVGDVIDIRLFYFTLNEIRDWVDADQPTGRVVHIPNSRLFVEPQANYTYGFPLIWHEIPVRVTFESNWQRAKAILTAVGEEYGEKLSELARQQIVRESQRHLIFYQDFQPIVFTQVRENGIQLTLRYLCATTRRRQSEHQIWEEVLTQFLATPDIRFAYPTTRFYQPPDNP